MDTDDVPTHLERLAAELTDRGWIAELHGTPPVLHVRNPRVPELSDTISCAGEAFRWECAQDITAVTDVTGAVDRITHVLRDVTSQ